jgi:hypothetical protein
MAIHYTICIAALTQICNTGIDFYHRDGYFAIADKGRIKIIGIYVYANPQAWGCGYYSKSGIYVKQGHDKIWVGHFNRIDVDINTYLRPKIQDGECN